MIIKLAKTETAKNDALMIRKQVFVNEQNIPLSIELDEHDETAIHFVGYLDDIPISASRLRIIKNEGKLERISVLKQYRKNGYGKQMIQKMETHLQKLNIKQSTLNAQTEAKDFYKQLGYHIKSNPFIEANIPHVTMKKQLES